MTEEYKNSNKTEDKRINKMTMKCNVQESDTKHERTIQRNRTP